MAMPIGTGLLSTTVAVPKVSFNKVGRIPAIPSFTLLANSPIAPCEVQGYVFSAKLGISEIAAAMGRMDLADHLSNEAGALQERFENVFWCESIGNYALALDGSERPCEVRASNPGHCLYCGIAGPGHAEAVIKQLTSEPFFSGWGMRTIAEGEARYNPMSYHNGSVWPHDNALIAAGFVRYRFTEIAARLMSGSSIRPVGLNSTDFPNCFADLAGDPGKLPRCIPWHALHKPGRRAPLSSCCNPRLGYRSMRLGSRSSWLAPFCPDP